MQRKERADEGSKEGAPELPSIVALVIAQQGAPLPSDVVHRFEPRLGVSLADVRVHTDARASQSARAIDAHAYTAGTQVVFGEGKFAPTTSAGERLLAHELTHVAQHKTAGSESDPRRAISSPDEPAEREAKAAEDRAEAPANRAPASRAQSALIHREGDGSPATTDTTTAQGTTKDDEQKPAATKEPPPPKNDSDVSYSGIVISGNPKRTRYDLWTYVVARRGRKGLADFYLAVRDWYTPASGMSPTQAFPNPQTAWDAKNTMNAQKVLGDLAGVITTVAKEVDDFVADFETKAKNLTRTTLDANEKEVNDEATHYGIKTETIPVSDCLAGDCITRKHSMDANAPGGKDIQAAAKILLDRRKAIETKRSKMESYHHSRCDHRQGECFDTYDPPYEPLSKELVIEVAAYNSVRGVLANQFPVLEQVSDISSSSSDLETLATKGPGSDMAAIIGEQIAEKLANIGKVRGGLEVGGSVNVWRLPRVLGLARAALQIDADPTKRKLVEDKIEDEKPGILQAIAIAVLNVAALLLAGPTGGISLAIAAGVNVAVAAHDVKEYLIQDALANSSFRAAQAISADQPSLFWLALEIVGTALDVGGAASAVSKSVEAFRTLGPLVEAAKLAEEGADVEKAMKALSQAAEKVKDAKFAAKILGEVRAARGGGSAELIAAGATRKEIQSLEKVVSAGDQTILKETKAIENVSELSAQQVNREIDVAKRSPRVTPDEGYVEAFRLENGHTWQRTPDGQWCRFSGKGMCVVFGESGGYHIQPAPATTHLPASNGTWEGVPGKSAWQSDNPEVLRLTNYEPIPFKDGYPDFSRWSRAQVGIEQTGDRAKDFAKADKLLAKERGWLKANGEPNAAAAERFRQGPPPLTWHHHQDTRRMLLVPTELHANVPHSGGVSAL